MPAWPPCVAVMTCPSSCRVSCSDLISNGSSSTSRMRSRRPTAATLEICVADTTEAVTAGNTNDTVVPLPTSLATSISALWRWTIPYTIARPSPVPRSPLVVKKGSRHRRRVSSSMPTPGVAHVDGHARAHRRRPSCGLRTLMVPPFGMASTALNIRLVRASRISCSAPMISRQRLGQIGG